ITIDVRTDDPAQAEAPIANNDHVSVVINTFPSATGDVLTNDRFGSSINFNGSSAGKYGFLNAPGTSGVFTYTLFESTTNADLPTTGIDTETYSYTLTSANGATDTANLTIDVNADPAFSGGAESPIARDDNVTITPNLLDGDGNVIPATINNNVITNDSNGDYVVLSSSPSSLYGTITLEANGDYTYKVYETATSITNLKAGEVVTDTFSYTYFANSGESANAQIIIQIIGNPIDANGDTIFENPDDQPYDNVDVEFNNSPQQATPLNSSRNILGHLYDTLDTDWYFLPSEGDEIITLEVCPKGTSCFGKKSWVLYVFALDQDADGNITGIVNRNIGLRRWLDETAGTVDLSGATILTPEFDTISHMYAAYRKGNFEGQLIGIVDPCFDTLNSVDIGVKADTNTNAGDGDPKNYVFAISSVLRGNGESEDCGDGTIILTRPGTPVSGHDADNDDGSPGAIKSYAVTEEYITVFPFSDDQYAIKITGTGLEPLLSERAAASSATFDSSTGTLSIPRVRVNEESYTATLDLQTPQARSENSPLKFVLSELGTSDLDSVLKTYRATYNAETQQVLIPRVTDTASGLAYSVVLSFQDNDNGAWFEVVSIKEIK
ncbi:MAG: hypothetical protein GQ582_11955, partial [Methyloprofundus sp.]|nr:hypothetical protein [Methyloprofundus sp.]